MQPFFGGASGDEQAYQAWLDEHDDGFVFSTHRSGGKCTLHKAWCNTISYNQTGTGHAGRSIMYCFDSLPEAKAWVAGRPDLHPWQEFCPQCG